MPIECPDQDHIEAAAAGITHQLVESGAAGLRPGDPVNIFMDDFVAALGGHLAEVEELSLRVLIQAGDPKIQGGAFHWRRLFCFLAICPCSATYCWMCSINTSVMFTPWAAVADLKALWSSMGTFRFKRFTSDSVAFLIFLTSSQR